jgi:hypothetical protein
VPRPPPPDPPGRDPQWADAGSGGYTRLGCGCPHAHTPSHITHKNSFSSFSGTIYGESSTKKPPRRVNTILTKITCTRYFSITWRDSWDEYSFLRHSVKRPWFDDTLFSENENRVIRAVSFIRRVHIGARALHVLNLIWFGNIARLY